MIDLYEATEELVRLVQSAGLDSASDTRNLNLPAVWVTPNSLTVDTLSRSSGTGEFDLWLIYPDNGEALAGLSEMLKQLATVIPVNVATAVSLNLPNHGADPLPGLQTTTTIRITEE